MGTKTGNAVVQSLPSPADRPDSNIVIFDGHCRFCQQQVSRLNRWDLGNILSFLSLHDPLVSERWPELTYDQLMKEMYLVDTDGNKYAGAYAFRWLSRKLVPLWVLAPLMHIPYSMPLWSWAYRVIAKQRYRWGKTDGCDGGSCKLHFD